MDTRKPNDIPDEVWEKAEKHRQHWARGPSTIKEAVARAILAETEANETEHLASMEEIAALRNELEICGRLATDRRYFMEAYRSMLGPNGLKVAAMWKAKNVKRVHHSWGPEANKLSGEERAAFILDWEEARRTAVPVESIDGRH